MATPFIYTHCLPEDPDGPSSPWPLPYATNYYTPRSPHSPFFPGSVNSTPTSANPPSSIPLPPPPAPPSRPVSLPPAGPTTYATWTDILTRPRSSTYSGPPPPSNFGYVTTIVVPTALVPGVAYVPTWHYYQPYVLTPVPATSPSHPQLHPYLDIGSPSRPDFLFDLDLPTFSPMRVIHPHNRFGPALLTGAELSQPAMHPQRTSLRVICDAIPHWPMDLVYIGHGSPPAITVGDVLSVVHTKLHECITAADWARLDERSRTQVAKAYRSRCRNAGPALERAEKGRGVKKVDYLQGRTSFRGLDWVVDGCLSLHTA